MAAPNAKTFDFLTGAEGDYMEVVMSQLADVPWAKPLTSDIEAAGGLKGENKAKLFELRFGHELHRASIQPQYEVSGEAKSTIDYGFSAGGTDFLVEMMRLEETDAVKAATTAEEFQDGAVMFARHLHSNAEENPRTPAT